MSRILERIETQFEEDVIQTHSQHGQDTAIVSRGVLLDLGRLLKDDPDLNFDCLMDVTAVDYHKRKPRFEVVYHFFSYQNRTRLRVKVPLPGEKPEVESLTPLWSSANWYEREVYDMFGIHFRNHPDLRRILMYPEFEGYPLRKDYPIDRRQPLIGPRD